MKKQFLSIVGLLVFSVDSLASKDLCKSFPAALRLLAVLLCTVCVGAPCSKTFAQSLTPKSVKATYEMYRNKLLVATVEETFMADNDNYQIESVANPTGLLTLISKDQITRRSKGKITAEGLRPESFEEKQTGRKERSRAASFEWDKKKLHLSYDDKSETVSLQKGTQDWSSLYYQFLFKAPAKETVKIIVTNGKKVESYTYQFIDEPTINIPAGKFETRHYAYKEENGDRQTELWLAKDKSSFPVKVVLHEDGNDIEQRLVSLEMNE